MGANMDLAEKHDEVITAVSEFIEYLEGKGIWLAEYQSDELCEIMKPMNKVYEWLGIDPAGLRKETKEEMKKIRSAG